MMIMQLATLFKDKPEPWTFLLLHNQYINMVDDLIDEEFKKERLFRALYLASLVYSCDYFIRNRNLLLPIEHMLLNMYADSTNWELTDDTKKRQAADVNRHCGQEMIFAVIKLEFGFDMLRELSPKLRESFLNT